MVKNNFVMPIQLLNAIEDNSLSKVTYLISHPKVNINEKENVGYNVIK